MNRCLSRFIMPVLLLITIILSACSTGGISKKASISVLKGMSCVEATDDEVLCVISPNSDMASWYKFYPDIEPHPIPAPPAVLAGVRELSVSPSGRYLAVLSVGEGHPIVTVLSYPSVLKSTWGRDARAFVMLDPYPGYIDIVGWEGDTLVVRANTDLTTGEHQDEEWDYELEFLVKVIGEDFKISKREIK